MLEPIRVPPSIRRIAVYLRPEDLPARRSEVPRLSWFGWVRHLNRVVAAVPVTLAGDEPALYPHFYDLLDGLRGDLDIQIETHLGFDVGTWLARVPPERFEADRLAPVLLARFDPRNTDMEAVTEKALLLQGAGFSVAFRAVLVPTHKAQALAAAEQGRRAGLDSATEPFFGWMDGRLMGQYRYREAALGGERPVSCRSTQLLVAPTGELFGCHHHLLAGMAAMGRISQERPQVSASWRACNRFGSCDPRDLAVTADRAGHLVAPPVEILPRRRRRAAS